MELKVEKLRREYEGTPLRRSDLDPDPFRQFEAWFEAALAGGAPDANAMMLATANSSGEPSARVVLLKRFDSHGFVFFTDYNSRKARDLDENPSAGLTFYWTQFSRQVRIEGRVTKVSRAEAEEYFRIRPRGSQLAAAVSRQSAPVSSRSRLEGDMKELEKKLSDQPVPTPPAWGGFCLKPDLFEFWQGQLNRLHDRFQYTRRADEDWEIVRLAP